MLGAFVAWLGLTRLGPWLGHDDWAVNYWAALVLSPLVVGAFGMLIERVMLKRLYHLDHLYGLLLTFGLALVIEGMFRQWFGISGESYDVPEGLSGAIRLEELGIILPKYRIWVVAASLVVCFLHLVGDRAHQAGRVSARRHRKPAAAAAFGVNVPLMITLTYGYGVAAGGFRRRSRRAGVPGQPCHGLESHHRRLRRGGDRRHGSILGAIVTRPGSGPDEGLTRFSTRKAPQVVIFVSWPWCSCCGPPASSAGRNRPWTAPGGCSACCSSWAC